MQGAKPPASELGPRPAEFKGRAAPLGALTPDRVVGDQGGALRGAPSLPRAPAHVTQSPQLLGAAIYKGTSRNLQRFRDNGRVKGNSWKSGKPRKLGGKPKGALAAKIDRGVEARQNRAWLVYLDDCAKAGVTPVGVPPEIEREWRRRRSGRAPAKPR